MQKAFSWLSSLSLQICRDAAVAHGRKTLRRPGNGKRPLPVTAVPMAPVMPMPAAVPVMPAAVPVMVPMMSPADLFGLEVPDLFLGGNGRMDIVLPGPHWFV